MSFNQFIIYDQAYSEKLAAWDNGRFRHGMAWLLARSGDSLFWFIITGWLLWNQEPLGWRLLTAILIAAVITATAKGIFKRQRPVEKWAIATDKYAFPSGHASRAAVVAVMLAAALPQVALVFPLWAFLVSVARVILSRHFLSDVIGGLLLGYGIGIILLLIW